MVMMLNKELIAFFLIGFWLFLPIPLMLFGVGGYNTVDSVNAGATWGIMDYIGIYFKLLVFSIPDAPLILKYFVHFLQIMTVLFILIILFNK